MFETLLTYQGYLWLYVSAAVDLKLLAQISNFVLSKESRCVLSLYKWTRNRENRYEYRSNICRNVFSINHRPFSLLSTNFNLKLTVWIIGDQSKWKGCSFGPCLLRLLSTNTISIQAYMWEERVWGHLGWVWLHVLFLSHIVQSWRVHLAGFPEGNVESSISHDVKDMSADGKSRERERKSKATFM